MKQGGDFIVTSTGNGASPRRIRVLVADDHAVLRNGLRQIIAAEPDLEMIGECADGADALALAASLRPDVVLMDLSMPHMGGIEATRRLRDAMEPCRVLVFSVHEDRAYLREALEAGVAGYLLKRASSREVVEAIRTIAGGRVYLDNRVTGKFINMVMPAGSAPPPDAPELTGRELEVLRHIAEGFSNKEIGALLNVSVKTIETHKARSMKKLGLRSRVDIVRMARERNWAPVAVPASQAVSPPSDREPADRRAFASQA